MMLIRIVPHTPGYDMRTFECPSCKHSESAVVHFMYSLLCRSGGCWRRSPPAPAQPRPLAGRSERPFGRSKPADASALAAGTLRSVRLAQPRARSTVFRVNEDDACIFERALYGFDRGCPHRTPALEVPHHTGRHSGRTGETTLAPSKSLPREKTLNRENRSHGTVAAPAERPQCCSATKTARPPRSQRP
jgi:hypothetical protein